MVGLFAILFLTLGLAIPGVLSKNTALTWASVPMWIILGVYIRINYTWLAEVQWVFILLGFGLAVAMAFETTTYKTKKDVPKTGDEVDDDGMEEAVENRRGYQHSINRFRKAMGKSPRFEEDEDE